MSLLIKNGQVVDPANKKNGVMDILIQGTKILQVAKDINAKADTLIDATAKFVLPGLVDMHVHLREPGREDKETIATGTAAALKGGVTTLLAMPNTLPAMDNAEHLLLLKEIIKKTAKAHVLMSGTITKERLGKVLTDIAKLKKAGAVAITDDGSSVESNDLLLKALKKAKSQRILTICHSEDKSLSGNGVVNLGIISTRLGLRGIPKEAEYKIVQRDISLAKKAQARIHIAHVSCKESVELIAKAKDKRVKVSADTAPHYFCLSEDELSGYDTNLKMKPPLRNIEDVEAIRQGLKDGIIDAIASDHAPHTESEKDIEFERAEFGVIGLETELAAAVTVLVEGGWLDWKGLVEKLSMNPAKILGIDKGTLGEGKDADIAIVDPEREWVVEKEGFLSKSKNSPFLGKKLKGLVEYTICGGKIVYKI